jgi:uncharacterized protein YggE
MYVKLAVAGATVLAAAGLGGGLGGRALSTQALVNTAPSRTITATGNGQATATPDILNVTLGVQTNATTATRALATNNIETQAVINKVEADGVAAKDVQTSQLSLNANYSPQGQKINSYTASDVLTVTIRQLSRAGRIIDDAVSAAGNDAQLQYISYSVSDPTTVSEQAHADAVYQAHAEAAAMAAAAGVTLGAAQTVTDINVSSPAGYGIPLAATGSGTAGGPASIPVPVQPGTQSYTVQVAVTYAID